MKITSVGIYQRKRAFEVRTPKGTFEFPFAKADPAPSEADPMVAVHVDKELSREAFTYELESGAEGTVHIDQVLDYHQEPGYMADLLLYKLTVEAQNRLDRSGIGIRQVARRLRTSPSQLYRLLDTTNYRKSVRQVLSLLHALDCEVDLVVRDREAV
jgi:hypothetical protein